MVLVFVPGGHSHPKRKPWTRRQRARINRTAEREARAAAKLDARRQLSRARRANKTLAIFAGCDPERTLALLGEEF